MNDQNDDLEFNIKLERSIPSQPTAIEGPKAQNQEQQMKSQYYSGANNSTTANTTQNQTQPQGGVQMPEFLKESSQPSICILHFGFKLAALVCYLVMNFVVRNLILTYIFVLILVIMDFWVVKNITGPRLVGLKWESFIKEDGQEEWIYYADSNSTKLPILIILEQQNKADNRVFWYTNYANPAVWIILVFINLTTLSVSNGAVCLFSAFLSGWNLLNYQKCEKNHGQLMSKEVFQVAKENLTQEQMMKIGQEAAKIAIQNPGLVSQARKL